MVWYYSLHLYYNNDNIIQLFNYLTLFFILFLVFSFLKVKLFLKETFTFKSYLLQILLQFLFDLIISISKTHSNDHFTMIKDQYSIMEYNHFLYKIRDMMNILNY